MHNFAKWFEESADVQEKHDMEWVIPCACDCGRLRGERCHLWVNVEKEQGYCFRCGKSYDVIELIRLVTNCDFHSAHRIYQEGESLDDELQATIGEITDPEIDADAPTTKLNVVPPVGYRVLTKTRYGSSYAILRGVSYKWCKFLGIGEVETGYFSGRTIVPVLDTSGNWATFVARWHRGDDKLRGKPKILYPKGSRKSEVLFGEPWASKHKIVVITEGVFDALAVGVCGVALLGKFASKSQHRRLVALGQERKLVVMLDPDARDDAEALAESLAPVCPDVRLATLPGGRKDPGECTHPEIVTAVRNAEIVGAIL